MTILSYIIAIILYCIVLHSIKRDWSLCNKVVFRVGNQSTKCDKQQSNVSVLLHRVQVCTEHHQYNSTQVVFMEV